MPKLDEYKRGCRISVKSDFSNKKFIGTVTRVENHSIYAIWDDDGQESPWPYVSSNPSKIKILNNNWDN